MVLDFERMNETVLHEFKGGTGDVLAKMHTDGLGKIMLGRLAPGCAIGFHQHETSSEIIYILQGKADFLYDEGTEEVSAGQCHYCPKGHWHSLRNFTGKELVYFAVISEQ